MNPIGKLFAVSFAIPFVQRIFVEISGFKPRKLGFRSRVRVSHRDERIRQVSLLRRRVKIFRFANHPRRVNLERSREA